MIAKSIEANLESRSSKLKNPSLTRDHEQSKKQKVFKGVRLESKVSVN